MVPRAFTRADLASSEPQVHIHTVVECSSLLRRARTNPTSRRRLSIVCEAKAAAQLAMHLAGHARYAASSATALLGEVDAAEQELLTRHGVSCADMEGGSLHQQLDSLFSSAASPSGSAPSAVAVKQLCTPSNLVLRLGEAERTRQVLTARTVRAAWGLMRVCGVLALERLLEPATIEEVAAAQAKHFAANVSSRVAEMHSAGIDHSADVAIRGSTKRVEVKRCQPHTQCL